MSRMNDKKPDSDPPSTPNAEEMPGWNLPKFVRVPSPSGASPAAEARLAGFVLNVVGQGATLFSAPVTSNEDSEAIVELFRGAPPSTAPQFLMRIPVRDVPQALLALPPDVQVEWITESPSDGGMPEVMPYNRGEGRAGDVVQAFRDKVAQQASGFWTLYEAGVLLEKHLGGNAVYVNGQDDCWIGRLTNAAEIGNLPMYTPVTRERIAYGRERGVYVDWDWAHADDLNRWLVEHEPRVTFPFEGAVDKASSASDLVVDARPETPVERETRLLGWFEEEKQQNERGALARTARREGDIAHQTLSEILKRARKRKAESENPMAAVARSLRK